MKNINDVITKLPKKRRVKIEERAEQLMNNVRPVLKAAPYEPKQILIKKRDDA